MKQRIYLALKGACMGFADAIPGVSGGTMALILGVYERFIGALTVVLSPGIFAMLVKGAFWRALFARLVPRGHAPASPSEPPDENEEDTVEHAVASVAFLINITLGIVAGLGVGVVILPTLMDRFPEAMRAFFFGLVLASIVVPWSRIGRRTGLVYALLAVTVVATFMLMGIRKNISGFATTTVTVSTADGAPLAEALEFAPQNLKFARKTGKKKLRREVSFSPTRPLKLEKGAQTWTFEATANLAGTAANVKSGSLVQVVDSSTKPHKLIETLSVVQVNEATGGTDPALWYIFVCGAVAICAMILPGVSGAFLLLMLGLYGYILHMLRALVTADSSAVAPVLIFIVGIVCGLALFSRALRYGLEHWHDPIMAVLTGLMLGSLRALWPFRIGVGHDYENTLPKAIDGTSMAVVMAAIVGISIVLALHRFDQSRSKSTQPDRV